MRDRVTTVIEAMGLGVFIAGCGMIYEPLTFVVGGAVVAWLGYLVSRP